MREQASSLSTIIVVIIVAVFIAGSGALLLSSRPDPVQITINPPVPTSTPLPTSTPEPILVYITGAVNQPETTIELPHDSRVMDAISAAGGFTDNANQTLVNIAGILRDGDQIHVPEIITVEQPQTDNTDTESVTAEQLPTPSGGNVIYVNTATLEELQALPGVGPAMAQRIIDYRTENGPFTQLDDLDNVSGIGPATLENLQDLIAFD